MASAGLKTRTGSEDTAKNGPNQKPVTLLISGIQGCSFPRLGSLQKPQKYYLQISTKGITKETSVSKKSDNPTWGDSLAVETDTASTVTFRVYSKGRWASDRLIGSVDEKVGSLVPLKDKNDFTCVLISRQRDSQTKHTIQFTVKSLYESDRDRKVIDQARQEAENLVAPTPAPIDYAESSASQLTSELTITSVSNPWESLLNKVELFSVLVDRVAEIHPYSKMAWSILSIAHRVILAQKHRDEAINDLVSVMDDTLSFVSESEPLKKIESHKSIIERMAQQVVECAYFIRDYAKNKSFWQRSLKHAISDIDKKIAEFSQKLEEFKASLQSQSIIQTEVLVLRILDHLADMATDMVANVNLTEMHYAKGAGYNPEKGCLPGTRGDIMTDIIDWVNLPDGENTQRVFWLGGVAGSGKSAIAHSIARQFDRQKRLGSFFCFDASRATDRRPYHLFGTISLDVSHLDSQWKKALLNIIKDNHALLTTESVQLQFESFLLGPSANLTSVGPIVIIIDALDESGDLASRKGILSMLSKRSSELPPNFRIIVTSRPEKDIEDAFSNNPLVCRSRMDTIVRASNDSDITAYIRSQLSELPSLDDEWFSDVQCSQLVDASEGLFQWAATACLFIQGNGKIGADPSDQFRLLLSQSSRGHKGLDSLYYTVLERVCPTDPAAEERFRLVLGRVLAVQEPLSISALSELRKKDEPAKMVGFTLLSLGSLFSGVTEHSQPIRPLHTSIRDFLTDPQRSGRFYVDLSLYHYQLALACFRVMKDGLRFNICEIETSYLRNVDIPDLPTRIAKNISLHLGYSCRFWGVHLRSSQFNDELVKSLRVFLYNQLLYWLEVMSVNKVMGAVPRAMLDASEWCKNHDSDVNVFIKDVKRFVAAFANAFEDSVPHIYLSALPFAPKESFISTTFLPKFSNTISVQTGKLDHWLACENVMEGHQRAVQSVSFCPDGRWIVSGSADGTVRIWDVEVGVAISPPLKGHTDAIFSTVFSPDGKRIASGSLDNTIRLWDAETGEPLGSPLEEHTDVVTSVVFSPDGSKLASASWDTTIILWDAETWNTVRLLEGHTDRISSIAFSPNGELIVSASEDKTIRVWDVDTGDVCFPPLCEDESGVFWCVAFSPSGEHIAAGSTSATIWLWDITEGPSLLRTFTGHIDEVNTIAFSPDGHHIISGSDDNAIRLWDVESGDAIGVSLKEHAGAVDAIAFSPDGKRVASGSRDSTIKLWDVQTWIATTPKSEKDTELLDGGSPSGSDTGIQRTNEEPSCQPTGHESYISSVTFSPDGKQIASGGCDNTGRIWDSKTGEAVFRPLKGHTDFISSIAYSPDGKLVASGSRDRTVRLWNAQTGETVSGCPQFGIDVVVFAVTFSPDGARIACGLIDGTIVLCDSTTGGRIGSPFTGHSSTVYSVAFSPDGSRLVSCSKDRTVRQWDVETGEAIGEPYEGHDHYVVSICFSPDANQVVSGSFDKKIILWDVHTGTAVGSPFMGHTRGVYAVAFSPDGRSIVSGSSDATVRIWDTDKHASVAIFTWHSAIVSTAVFSPDGKRIVSGSFDKAIRVWDVDAATQVESPMSASSSRVPDFGVSSRMEKGWVMDSASSLIFWVPSWYRAGLCWPPDSVLIHEDPVKLDLSRFKHGYAWMQCKT